MNSLIDNELLKERDVTCSISVDNTLGGNIQVEKKGNDFYYF